MKIALVNASPKPGIGTSSFLLDALANLLPASSKLTQFRFGSKLPPDQALVDLCSHDVVVLAFPLYVDAIPSSLFRVMVRLQELLKTQPVKDRICYAVINNGFYEGRQNQVAFEILNHWCLASGIRFGGGLGHGAGEMLGQLRNIPLGRGPLKNLGTAMRVLADDLEHRRTAAPRLINPNFPRFLWRFAATHSFWNAQARKNGLSPRDLLARPRGSAP